MFGFCCELLVVDRLERVRVVIGAEAREDRGFLAAYKDGLDRGCWVHHEVHCAPEVVDLATQRDSGQAPATLNRVGFDGLAGASGARVGVHALGVPVGDDPLGNASNVGPRGCGGEFQNAVALLVLLT